MDAFTIGIDDADDIEMKLQYIHTIWAQNNIHDEKFPSHE